MKTKYLFSSAGGDIELAPADLDRPFLISPTTPHAFLTLGHYFSSLEHFILQDNGGLLGRILRTHFPEFPGVDKIETAAIRSEKHGALYHVASVELLAGNASCRLAATAALGESNQQLLRQEFDRLEYLHHQLRLDYLPRVYFHGKEELQIPAGTETVSFVLGQWLTGFHEWHLTIHENRPQVCLWDTEAGNRFLSEGETRQLIREAARILTLYYNVETFQQIAPWHHAAGDFVARSRGGSIDLRLITARGYEPLPGFSPAAGIGPDIGLVVFLLNLTLQIRLDRLDGVGAIAWFEDFAVLEALKGFFAALTAQETEGRIAQGLAADLLAALQAFTPDDLSEIYEQLVASEATEVSSAQLEAHCRSLWLALADINPDIS